MISKLSRRILCGAAFALAAALIAGCGGGRTSVPTVTPKPSTLGWLPCQESALAGLECATLAVPKDYGDPSRGMFSLAIARARATGPENERIGTLFFNPGGPGESGVDLVADIAKALPSELRARFDFVSWDPRGVKRSSGLNECQGGSYTLAAAGPVDWVAVADQMRASQGVANQACAARYPDVVPYIGTNATVQDIDQLREAVGDERLTYWGTSYGTRIGFLYAYRYPDRVRAMLLSSPVDPNATLQSFMQGSATSPDNALGFFFQVRPDAKNQFDRVLNALSMQALALPSGAQVTQWDVKGFLGGSVKSEGAFATMAAYVAKVDTAMSASGALQTAAIADLDSQQWMTAFPINGGATSFIDCLDFAQRPTRDEQIQLSATIRVQAPIFGWVQSAGLFFCEGIDVRPQPVPVNFLNTQTPMLVIGSTRDALTQYGWVNEVARNFTQSRVVTYVGTQHTPYLAAGSACVDGYGTDYLLNLRLPSTDVTCQSAIVLQ